MTVATLTPKFVTTLFNIACGILRTFQRLLFFRASMVWDCWNRPCLLNAPTENNPTVRDLVNVQAKKCPYDQISICLQENTFADIEEISKSNVRLHQSVEIPHYSCLFLAFALMLE